MNFIRNPEDEINVTYQNINDISNTTNTILTHGSNQNFTFITDYNTTGNFSLYLNNTCYGFPLEVLLRIK